MNNTKSKSFSVVIVSVKMDIHVIFRHLIDVHSHTVQYGSANGSFKIEIFITHLSYNLFENNFTQNYGIQIGFNWIASN